jgi:hypothetical protein
MRTLISYPATTMVWERRGEVEANGRGAGLFGRAP